MSKAIRTAELTSKIQREAIQLGFASVGICPAVPAQGFERFREWLASGFAGQMTYLDQRADAYRHPDGVLGGARSLVVMTMNYRNADPIRPVSGQGRVSRYAWGTADYHDLIHAQLKQLLKTIADLAPGSSNRGVVDTAPLFEREFAQLAGLGWVGKHTLLLNREAGSWFFLAVLLTDLELEYDQPTTTDYCGTCTACLDACPTNAFPQPYLLDASRCISYLTIELRDAMPMELRESVGDWVFGCDVCQEVCPWNRQAPASQIEELEPHSRSNPMALEELFDLDDAAFRARFRHTPLWRPKRRGLLRNAAIVLGNQRDPASVPALNKGLNDQESLVRGACAWALGQLADEQAVKSLQERRDVEMDPDVVNEIEMALAGCI